MIRFLLVALIEIKNIFDDQTSYQRITKELSKHIKT
jgi:hypothetical protein